MWGFVGHLGGYRYWYRGR